MILIFDIKLTTHTRQIFISITHIHTAYGVIKHRCVFVMNDHFEQQHKSDRKCHGNQYNHNAHSDCYSHTFTESHFSHFNLINKGLVYR